MNWIVNPEWENAKYELMFKNSDGKTINDPYPRRFNKPIPDDLNEDRLWQWILENEVPRLITHS